MCRDTRRLWKDFGSYFTVSLPRRAIPSSQIVTALVYSKKLLRTIGQRIHLSSGGVTQETGAFRAYAMTSDPGFNENHWKLPKNLYGCKECLSIKRISKNKLFLVTNVIARYL